MRPDRALSLCSLLLQIPRCLLQGEVALFIGTPGPETCADECRPCSALEKQDGEDDTETETEGRFDKQVREAAVPLG